MDGGETAVRLPDDAVGRDRIAAAAARGVLLEAETVPAGPVPGDLDVHVPLVFYELHRGGCEAAGDPTRLAVTKDRPSDILLTLVP